MQCYSQYHPHKEECSRCSISSYCKESTESIPPLLSDQAKKIPAESLPEPLIIKKSNHCHEKKYSRADMLELIGFLVAMDEKTLEILSEKLQNPLISLAEIGRKKKITRQAIHKFLKSRCEQIPEIAAVFNKKTEKTQNFMEAVCQIKQKSSENNSKEPAISSNSCRSLINLSQSLDLSRLSIGKELNN